MITKLSIITLDEQRRDFCFHSDDLELIFDLLHQITQAGDRLIKAELIDSKSNTKLALDPVAKAPFANPIHQLRQQWEAILRQPASKSKESKRIHSKFKSTVLANQQQRVEQNRRLLSHMLCLIERTQQTMLEGPYKTKLLSFYQTTINRCMDSIARLETYSTRLSSVRQ